MSRPTGQDANSIPKRRRGPGTRRRFLVAGLLYVVASIARYGRILFSGHGYRFIGVFGDPLIFAWHLSWQAFAPAHVKLPLFTDHLFAPRGANLLNSTSIPLLGILAAPVTALVGPISTYNALITAAAAVSAWGAYAAIRPFCKADLPAWVGGLLYGFGGYVGAQSQSHLNLAFAPFPPLAMLLLVKIGRADRRRGWPLGLLLGLVVAAEFGVSEELAATTVMMVAVVTALAGPGEWRRATKTGAAVALVVAAWVVLATLTVPVAYQFLGPRSQVPSLLQPHNTFVADLEGFVAPSSIQLISTSSSRRTTARFAGLDGEFSTYVGIPLLLGFAASAVILRKSKAVRVASAATVIFAALSLGPSLHVGGHDLHVWLPWRLVDRLPLLQNILPDRLALYVDLGIAFVTAVGLDRLLDRASLGRRASAMVAAVIATATFLPVIPGYQADVRVPPFFTTSAVDQIPAGANVLVTPLTEHGEVAMLWQGLAHFRFRMPDGAVFVPGGYGVPNVALLQAVRLVESGGQRGRLPTECVLDAVTGPSPGAGSCRGQLLDDLARLKITCVASVAYGPHAAAVEAFFSDLLGSPPTDEAGVSLWCRAVPPAYRGQDG